MAIQWMRNADEAFAKAKTERKAALFDFNAAPM